MSSSPSSPCCTTRDALLLATLSALALVLRLLGRDLESIWFDESVSLVIAGHGYLDLLTGRQADPGNPAGYFLLLRAWLGLWGNSIESARALSAVAGALSVPAVWLLARGVGATPRTTWLACLLVAVSPPLVYLGQEARVFALFATMTTLAVAAAARVQQTDAPRAWLSFAAAGAVLVHLHYYAFFVLFLLGLDLLIWAWPRGRGCVLRLLGASALVALAFAPYLPVFFWQLSLGASRSSESWWQHLGLLPSFSIVGRTLVWKEDGLRLVAALALVVTLLVYVPVLVWLGRARPWPRPVLALVVGLPVLLGLLGLAGLPIVHSHYLAVTFPALMLLLAWGIDVGLERSPRLVWAPVLCLLVLMPAALARGYLVRHKTDWRGLAATVARQGGALPIYFYEDIGNDPFAYYCPDQPRHPITQDFGKQGAGWQENGVLAQMRQERAGFWLVYYPTSSQTRSEEEGIVALLNRHWAVEQDQKVGQLRALLCRPR